MIAIGRQDVTVCQICGLPIGVRQIVRNCSACTSGFHSECWDELGGCATYGCPKMYETKKAEDIAITYWGAHEKTCPICAETIPVAELKCSKCGTDFDDISPLTREDILQQDKSSPQFVYRKTAILLFIVSAIGITSPLALLFGGIWYRVKRREIAQDATTRALTLVALFVATAYIILIVVGGVTFWINKHEV